MLLPQKALPRAGVVVGSELLYTPDTPPDCPRSPLPPPPPLPPPRDKHWPRPKAKPPEGPKKRPQAPDFPEKPPPAQRPLSPPFPGSSPRDSGAAARARSAASLRGRGGFAWATPGTELAGLRAGGGRPGRSSSSRTATPYWHRQGRAEERRAREPGKDRKAE
ncbi:hypothetical protein XELAEV_18000025mg [Xenopus laevis]|uniref:Uncharacterized protein n=1 Tax=Xenopus laevis TaxID=8355 RepID=A0A974GYM9_XENLA|nr:hypothetical protein XELAEV_18000025mg [Xenopus laevis]